MNDLLKKRVKEFSIPKFVAQMTFDNVAVWRLKNGERKTAGGLVIPDSVEDDVENRGVLVSAGPKAQDELYANGIEVGQIVWFGRFAGDEKQVVKRGVGEAEGQYMLLCKSKDVIAGEDLKVSLDNGSLRIARDEMGEHAIEDTETSKVRRLRLIKEAA